MRYYDDPVMVEELVKDSEAFMRFHLQATESFHYFNEVVLGHHDMNEEHRKLCEFIQHDHHKSKICLLPRYSYKSCVITQGLSLWNMYRDPGVRILIYSDSTTKAQGFLRGIKNHISGEAGRSRFRELMGSWETNPLSGTWNESQIVVSKRDRGHVEPTIDTAGIEQSKVGMHYDIIIFDDIVSKVNVTTKAQMDKVWECYQESLALLKPNGLVFMVGTRWHFGDAYGRILAENREVDTFGEFVRDAEQVDGDGRLIFESIGLDTEHLEGLKRRMGSYTYSCLMRNNPVDDDMAMFPSDRFKFYGSIKPAADPYKTGVCEDLYITCTLDPAGEGADRTGGVVVGTDHKLKMYVLDILNRQCQPDLMIDWVINMNTKYRIRMMGIETSFFRGMLKKELDRRIKSAKVENPLFNTFGIIEFSPSARRGENKFVRIAALQPKHEAGEILFPGDCIERLKTGFSDLAYQMMQMTPSHMPEPNDLLDALAFHVPLIQRGGMVKKDGPPKMTPAWIEINQIKLHNRMQRRLPRSKRRDWVPAFS